MEGGQGESFGDSSVKIFRCLSVKGVETGSSLGTAL